jgi:anthranilate phosphoribosyltransferase
MPDALVNAIQALSRGESLSADSTTAAFDIIMRGDATPAQIAALLMGLRVKGETADEIAGAAQALRNAMTPVSLPLENGIIDTCGTGGGSVTTFNISTATALLAAGAGARVAKHGNRSFTSRSGSADVLEALGVSIGQTPEQLAQIFAEAGIVFMFAPSMHPAMRHVGPVRKELGIATIMNVVGPLANPAHVRRQIVGVADRARMPVMAGALARLGAKHALVVHGEPGMDELSPLGLSSVIEIRSDGIEEWTVAPRDFGLHADRIEDLKGGDPAANAALIREVLSGHAPLGARNAVILNAAAAVYVAGNADTLGEGVEIARNALDAGAGLRALDALRQATAKTR